MCGSHEVILTAGVSRGLERYDVFWRARLFREKGPPVITAPARSRLSHNTLVGAVIACLGLAAVAQGQARLTSYQPQGWSDRVVVSTSAESTLESAIDASPLRTTDTLYVNWAVINDGTTDIMTFFNSTLYVDGTVVYSSSFVPPLPPNCFTSVVNYSIGRLAAGGLTRSASSPTGPTRSRRRTSPIRFT